MTIDPFLSADRHCPACEVAWQGSGLCWSCGKPGESGAFLQRKVSIQFCQPVSAVAHA